MAECRWCIGNTAIALCRGWGVDMPCCYPKAALRYGGKRCDQSGIR